MRRRYGLGSPSRTPTIHPVALRNARYVCLGFSSPLGPREEERRPRRATLERSSGGRWNAATCYGRFAARWLCLYLEEHDKATLEVGLLVANLRSLAPPEDHASALAILRKAARQG